MAQRLASLVGVFLLIIALIACEPTDHERATEQVVREYAWRIPVCYWQSDNVRCTDVATLVAAYPYRAREISEEVAKQIRAIQATSPEAILAKLGSAGVVVRCPETPQNLDMITLGTTESHRLKWSKDCLNSENKNRTPTLTSAVIDHSSNAQPALNEYDDAYNDYLAECEAEEAGPASSQPLPVAGDEKKKKKKEKSARQKRLEEEKKKNKEKLKQKQMELARAEEELKAAQEQAARGNPQPGRIEAATEKVEQAQKDVDDTQRDLEQIDKWLKDQKEWDERMERAEEFNQEIEDAVIHYTPMGHTRQLIHKIARAARDYFDPDRNKDCIAADCTPLTCREKAQVQALRDLLKTYDREPCSENATPVPGREGECYHIASLNGNQLSGAQMQAVQKRWCEERKKYMEGESGGGAPIDCDNPNREMPPISFDACTGPEVMCAPEQFPSWAVDLTN